MTNIQFTDKKNTTGIRVLPCAYIFQYVNMDVQSKKMEWESVNM